MRVSFHSGLWASASQEFIFEVMMRCKGGASAASEAMEGLVVKFPTTKIKGFEVEQPALDDFSSFLTKLIHF